MNELAKILSFIPGLVTSGVIVAVVLWKSDAFISEAGAKRLYGAINQAVASPKDSQIEKTLEAFLAQYLSPQGDWLRFLWRIFLLTLASLLLLLCIYLYKMPDLLGQLLTKGFLRQFIGNGIVVTFLVNCVIFSQYNRLIQSFVKDSVTKNLGLILADIGLKALIFVILTMLTYLAFALMSEAFNEDVRLAFRAGPITIWHAIFFRNLTSVYLYSLVLSSFPVFVVVLLKLMISTPKFAHFVQAVFFWLPFEGKPIRAIAIVFSILTSIFVLALTILVAWVR